MLTEQAPRPPNNTSTDDLSQPVEDTTVSQTTTVSEEVVEADVNSDLVDEKDTTYFRLLSLVDFTRAYIEKGITHDVFIRDIIRTSGSPYYQEIYHQEFDVNGNVIGTDNGVNPSFTFTGYGIYGVRLVVRSNNGCQDEIAFDQYITLEDLVADFSFLPPGLPRAKYRKAPGSADRWGLPRHPGVRPGLSGPIVFFLNQKETAGLLYHGVLL